jgi:hypothetical protein
MADSVEHAGPMVQMILARREMEVFWVSVSSEFGWLGFKYSSTDSFS